MNITNEQYLILNAVFHGYVRSILDAHLFDTNIIAFRDEYKSTPREDEEPINQPAEKPPKPKSSRRKSRRLRRNR